MPDLYLTGSVDAITDVNGDNLPDIFIGARAVPWSYGSRPESYLLINEGDGYFKIDESDFGKRFADVGMVTDAKWADMDGDGLPDLVRSEEHTSELQSRGHLVCRLLLEKKTKINK